MEAILLPVGVLVAIAGVIVAGAVGAIAVFVFYSPRRPGPPNEDDEERD